MKFEELTVGRTIHYRDGGMVTCRAATVIDSSGGIVTVRVLVPLASIDPTHDAGINDQEKVIFPNDGTWHDPRGCKP